MTLSRLLAGAVLAALMAQPALAQNQSTTQQQPPAQAGPQQLAEQDLEFARNAAEGGLKEVRLGQLAQQQAASEQVQQFGERMVEDHGNANEQLMQIAETKGIELPQELSQEAQQLYDELQQKSGADFDQAYMDEMASDHQKDVESFQQFAASGQDQELVQFAAETLPVLQQHLEMAEQISEQAVAATGSGQQRQAQQQQATQGEQQATGATIQASDVIGAEVVNESGEEVGEIKDLVIDADRLEYAVVSVGGFLGVGDKDVAIPLDQLKLGVGESYLMSGETEAQLEQMPEYQESQYQPRD
jgi:putative membrane protein